MPKLEMSLECPAHYSLRAACDAHGWNQLAPFAWEAEAGRLMCAAPLRSGSVDVSLRQSGSRVGVEVLSHRKLNAAERAVLAAMLRRSLDLDRSLDDLLRLSQKHGRDYENLIRGGSGRLLRGLSLWEDAAKTLFTTNCTWGLTLKMARALCSAEFSTATPQGAFPFPDPAAVAQRDSATLKAMMPVGYRAPYLHALAKEFLSDGALGGMETSNDLAASMARAQGLHGFGPYAAHHLLIMAGYFDHLPVDTIVTAFVKRNYRARNVKSFCARKYTSWRPYSWWGYKLDVRVRAAADRKSGKISDVEYQQPIESLRD